MRARRIQRCHNLRKEEARGKERLISRDLAKLAEREELKARPRKRETLIRNSLSFGGDTNAAEEAMRLEVFEIVCRASRNINRA